MQKIIPHLWFDKEAKEAATFYTSIFPDSKITSSTVIRDTPSGDCDVLAFELSGYQFMAISAGPLFKFNPSVSFILNFDPAKDINARENLDKLWAQLSDGGQVLMPLDHYAFSERYGWVQDKYGVSWQLMLTHPEGEERPFIIPTLFFVTETCDKAEEATDYYLTVFEDAKRGTIVHAHSDLQPNKEGFVMFTDFTLAGQWFAAMDGRSKTHQFAFNEAISFIVNCDTQKEIDFYWEKLSAFPENEQCGWCKDRYGLSWQIEPSDLEQMLRDSDEIKVKRVTEAFLKMKKFDIAKLRESYQG
jgi:predicted 3-demethylubiquinone-9 3-methyltransferase (glyoxalase superfamily)